MLQLSWVIASAVSAGPRLLTPAASPAGLTCMCVTAAYDDDVFVGPTPRVSPPIYSIDSIYR